MHARLTIRGQDYPHAHAQGRANGRAEAAEGTTRASWRPLLQPLTLAWSISSLTWAMPSPGLVTSFLMAGTCNSAAGLVVELLEQGLRGAVGVLDELLVHHPPFLPSFPLSLPPCPLIQLSHPLSPSLLPFLPATTLSSLPFLLPSFPDDSLRHWSSPPPCLVFLPPVPSLDTP